MSQFGQLQGEAASSQPPFIATGWRGNRHFQTIWANRIKRDPAGAQLAARSTEAIFESEDGDLLRLYWSRHGNAHGPDAPPATRDPRNHGHGHDTLAPPSADSTGGAPHPLLVVMHGLTGCADADNVMATAAKGYALGFDVVRIDLRNTQADDGPSLGIGHAGRSEDLRATLRHLTVERPGTPVAVIGFSMGGNITLKALGEYGEQPPEILRAVATISVPIDLDDACTAIDERRENWIYRTYFLRRLARRYRNAQQQRPDLFDPIDVDSIRGIREWDNAVVAPLGGFENAEDYYARNSALHVLGSIRVPTLLIHARDDPFIPFKSFETQAVRDNDWIRLLAPRQGGHVGFFSTHDIPGEPDRYWAENRAVAFCAAAVGLSWGSDNGGAPAEPPRGG